jgi:pyruvate kinase
MSTVIPSRATTAETDAEPVLHSRTKIVATVGPASSSPEGIAALLHAGVDVFRLNLSHGEVAGHIEIFGLIRKVSEELALPVGILCDLPGPKVRAASFPDGGVRLVEGDEVELAYGRSGSSSARIEVNDESVSSLEPGDKVALGDGAVTLTVTESDGSRSVATVIAGGLVQGRPGVHIPSTRLRMTTPTAQDFELMEHLKAVEPDFVALSFVRSAADVDRARAALGPGPMLVAKIETTAALDDLDAIVEAADALMVARGDLGIECAFEDVPHVQNRIIRTCVARGVPVITATQMLESMITSPQPTRAEVTDVTNAVFDGTDAVMLSGETAIGRDPAHVVRTMRRIAKRAEESANYAQWGARLGRLQRRGRAEGAITITDAMSHAAWQAADDAKVAAILCCTRSGVTARSLGRFRPQTQLIAITPSERTSRQLLLSWGVHCLIVEERTTIDEIVWFAVESSEQAGLVRQGDVVAVLAGAPDTGEAITDVLRLVRVR